MRDIGTHMELMIAHDVLRFQTTSNTKKCTKPWDPENPAILRHNEANKVKVGRCNAALVGFKGRPSDCSHSEGGLAVI